MTKSPAQADEPVRVIRDIPTDPWSNVSRGVYAIRRMPVTGNCEVLILEGHLVSCLLSSCRHRAFAWASLPTKILKYTSFRPCRQPILRRTCGDTSSTIQGTNHMYGVPCQVQGPGNLAIFSPRRLKQEQELHSVAATLDHASKHQKVCFDTI